MALIEWSNDLSVNVAEIDKQHQKLVMMLNDLHDAMKQGKGHEIIGKIITELINYSVVHFATEEKYFVQFNYPDTDSHKKEHADFVQQVSIFNDGFKKGKLMLTIDVVKFLREWLRKHIMGTDKKYTQFFNDNGLI